MNGQWMISWFIHMVEHEDENYEHFSFDDSFSK